MTDRHAFTIRFDDTFYQLVDEFWERRGSDHQRITHMTLGGFMKADEAQILYVAEKFAAVQPPSKLVFSHFGLFAGHKSCVLFHAPHPDPALFEYHRTLFKLMQNVPHEPQDGYTPENWVPHCSIDFRLSYKRLPALQQDAIDHFTPHFPIVTKITQMDVIRVDDDGVTFIYEKEF